MTGCGGGGGGGGGVVVVVVELDDDVDVDEDVAVEGDVDVAVEDDVGEEAFGPLVVVVVDELDGVTPAVDDEVVEAPAPRVDVDVEVPGPDVVVWPGDGREAALLVVVSDASVTGGGRLAGLIA